MAVNKSINSVTASLAGLIANHDNVTLYSQHNSIVRSDIGDSQIVRVISGGGSGHEPGHAGYVGRGMLSAAVCGEIFASPSVNAILNTILICADRNESAAILLIVTNYTGDRLNFGLAAEIAKTKYNIKNIQTLLVNDDCSIEKYASSVGKRGLAGTMLIQKILGAMAEDCCSLEEIYSVGDSILRNESLCTMGCSFTVRHSDNLITKIEIGKGVHGEPGAQKIEEIDNFECIVDIFCSQFAKKIKLGAKVVVLLNNLGGTSNFIMSLFSGILMKKLTEIYSVERYFAGDFLTSLNVEGLSVTVLSLDLQHDLILKSLDLEVDIVANHFTHKAGNRSKAITEPRINDTKYLDNYEKSAQHLETQSRWKIDEVITSDILTSCCNVLIANEKLLNSIDKEFGDGDTGSTMTKGAQAILKAIGEKVLSLSDPANMLQCISSALQNDMGGTSGALYSIFFQAASFAFTQEAEDNEQSGLKIWLEALQLGNNAIMKYGLAKIGDRTMIDPLKAGEESLNSSLQQGLGIIPTLELFANVCQAAALATTQMVPKSGRSAYSFADEKASSMVATNPDPGAICVSFWIRTLCDTLKKYFV